jgi:glycerol-3-phosphate dehydrogenase subunit C
MTRRVAYFVGCVTNYSEPEVGKAVVQLLRHNGFEVVVPEQQCCGMPAMASGDFAVARKQAEFNVRFLAEADCDVISTCPSCTLALKDLWGRVFPSEATNRVSRRSYDFFEYLRALADRGELKTDRHRVPRDVYYHPPCHLLALGEDLSDARLRLLRMIPGLSVASLDRGCCGMGGSFGLKRDRYDLSVAVGQPLFEAIKEQHPAEVLTDCSACALQIGQHTGLPVRHPAVLFASACGVGPAAPPPTQTGRTPSPSGQGKGEP